MVEVNRFLLLFIVNMILISAEEYPFPDMIPFLQELHNKCTALIGVTDDEVTSFQFPCESHKMKCYLHCVSTTSKWSNPDGTPDYQYIQKNCPEKLRNVMVPVVEKCLDFPRGADECENSYNFHVCVHEHAPQYWILP